MACGLELTGAPKARIVIVPTRRGNHDGSVSLIWQLKPRRGGAFCCPRTN